MPNASSITATDKGSAIKVTDQLSGHFTAAPSACYETGELHAGFVTHMFFLCLATHSAAATKKRFRFVAWRLIRAQLGRSVSDFCHKICPFCGIAMEMG